MNRRKGTHFNNLELNIPFKPKVPNLLTFEGWTFTTYIKHYKEFFCLFISVFFSKDERKLCSLREVGTQYGIYLCQSCTLALPMDSNLKE